MQSSRGAGRAPGSTLVNGRGHQHTRGKSQSRRRTVQEGKLSPDGSSVMKVLAFGLSLVGFGEERQRCRDDLCMRRFRAHYGVGPKAIRALIADLKKNQPHKPFDLSTLFMAISWLKLYELEEVMSGRWGFGEQYCRENVRDYVSRIQSLKSKKISFDGLDPKCRILPIDTVHIRSQEFRCDPSSKWYSHKSNGPAVSFEVVADPVEGKIRWTNGPEPASINDLTFFRGGKKGKMDSWKRSSLYFHLPNNVRLIGDSAYGGQPDKVSTTKDAHSPAAKKLFARMKSMQETCFKRFKDFEVLRESFRNRKGTEDKLGKIKMAFETTAVLVEYDLENGYRLFEV